MRLRAAWTSSSVTIIGNAIPRAPAVRQGSPRIADRSSALLESPGELDAVPHAELVEDGLEMALHRLRGDAETFRDLSRAQAVRDEQGDLPLALRQAVGGRRLGRRVAGRGDGRGHALSPEVQ